MCRSPATPTKGLRGDLSPGSGSINLSDPEVMARIGNRAIKTVQKSNSESSWIYLQTSLLRR